MRMRTPYSAQSSGWNLRCHFPRTPLTQMFGGVGMPPEMQRNCSGLFMCHIQYFQVAFLHGNQTWNECSAVCLPFIIAPSDFSAHCSKAPDFDDEFVDETFCGSG
uniref:Uncharacterized protein n=1 Tax=Micrurus lemniscatus lemniscatus TaxID=129467 RepID=A0A2D4HPA4_MICLE